MNGELEEEVYVMPPDGVECPGGHVWALGRVLYGLPQSGYVCTFKLHKALVGIWFVIISPEYCLYIHRNMKGRVFFLAIYVDDMLVAAKGLKFTGKMNRRLLRLFKMHDSGEAKHLCIEIIRDGVKRNICL